MKLTTTTLLTLTTATLTLAFPQSLGDQPTSPDTPSAFGPAYPVPDLGNTTSTPNTTSPSLTPRYFNLPPPRVRYCQHANGGGACRNQDVTGWTCYNFEAWWNDRVSSFYLNPGYSCWLHSDKGSMIS
ncbi:putative beta gamma crystallin [Diplodia seriata]|uniref:Putative beta gamma crystallin n=1 Tax=Diplodia seriata TaxID=420778 RepID=A0A0G2GXL6_9PEZI|nr:putative beta gamma crystallin [Diplodia seriata]